MTPKIIEGFVDPSSILTYGGASLAVWVVSATFRRVSRRETILAPLVVAFLVGFVIAYSTGALKTGLGWLVALVNCCILFSTATGMNESAAALAATPKAGLAAPEEPKGRFLSSWF